MRYVRTVVLLIAVAQPALCGCSESRSARVPADFGKTPVLFIHGSGLDAGSWDAMIDYLVANGYAREFLEAVNLEPNDGSNVRAAEVFIAPAVEELLSRAGELARAHGTASVPRKVDIVAHSMGAVSSRWYAVKIAPERVRTWVSVAGANHGTNALRRYPSPGNNELVPAFAVTAEQSGLQCALNGVPLEPRDETPYGLGEDPPELPSVAPRAGTSILYLCVFIDPDKWVRPSSSATLRGAGGGSIAIPLGVPVEEGPPGNFRFLGDAGHDALPSDPGVIRLVEAFLGARNGE